MLSTLSLEPLTRAATEFIPPIVQPLMDVGRGESLTAVLQDIVRGLGFDTFHYGVTTSAQPGHDGRSYLWTNQPAEWQRLYDERAYIEIDPRLRAAWNSTAPLLWDRRSFPDTREHSEFFDEASRYGIRSGVVVVLRNPRHAPALFMLNANFAVLAGDRRRHIVSMLGEIMVLGSYAHEIFLARVTDHRVPTTTLGVPLSPREVECLRLAARGLSQGQIGAQLKIAERTVHYHFGRLLAKLGAANRRDAIAKATASGLLGPQ
jgi:LuxR family quorum-sensing transcriptional regulator LasR